jgi:hypothetical protein
MDPNEDAVQFTGQEVWLDSGLRQPETKFMAQAKPGDRSGAYELSPVRLSGLPVWVRFDVQPPRTVLQASLWLAEKMALSEEGLGLARTARVRCTCEFVDIGIGLQKVSENPDCPACTELGYACWAVQHGTPDERVAARAYVNDFFGPVGEVTWDGANLSAVLLLTAGVPAGSRPCTEAGNLTINGSPVPVGSVIAVWPSGEVGVREQSAC